MKETFAPKHALKVMNTLTRKKELFEPLEAGYVGMYVCGPTVYSEVHLGNCRTFFSFDVIYRYLMYLGYKVRYVRNITDVGHLVGDVDEGEEDKISKQARLEQLEPMEIVQKYSNQFHEVLGQLNNLSPSIEPRATGHLIEQIEMVKDIIANGYGYEKNGSVYFDTQKLIKEGKALYEYGTLSGKKQEDLLTETRELNSQSDKRHPSDFAIWVKASDKHLMRWPSPWSEGYPGWHLECSAMSTKYLGKHFDIHGGGMDLEFPHHENEIAQNIGACGCAPVKYWLHTNMLLLNSQKMSKSTGNSITPAQLFSGENDLLSKAYSPMAYRFFMLQAHYSGELNITDKGLMAAEKGYHRLMDAHEILKGLSHDGNGSESPDDQQINLLLDKAFEAMSDDFNTAAAIGKLNGVVAKVNALANKRLDMSAIQASTLKRMQQAFQELIIDIFGLKGEESITGQNSQTGQLLEAAMSVILELREEARTNKNWATSDLIRDRLQAAGIQIKDAKEGAIWSTIPS